MSTPTDSLHTPSSPTTPPLKVPCLRPGDLLNLSDPTPLVSLPPYDPSWETDLKCRIVKTKRPLKRSVTGVLYLLQTHLQDSHSKRKTRRESRVSLWTRGRGTKRWTLVSKSRDTQTRGPGKRKDMDDGHTHTHAPTHTHTLMINTPWTQRPEPQPPHTQSLSGPRSGTGDPWSTQ